MSLFKPVTQALACRSCQRFILSSFIGSGAVSICASRRIQPRTYTTTIIRWGEQLREDDHALNEINNEVSHNSEPGAEPTQVTHVPWYLQVQQPIQQAGNPLADQQQIPDLPEHPPSLLEPLLKHVSVELGIDNLTLLDLRSLDPPPALGANLLMIIGTARSEKHLHVSADRLCRWLRTEYKLSPYADGLLGRNELKLKMRRKAKQTRLLSAVGAKATANAELDDGIRTGWVCVNIGRVPGGELTADEKKTQQAQEFVGFRAPSGGSSVVVQLLTDEKRKDLDLDALWMDTLDRAEIRQSTLTEQDSNAGSQEIYGSESSETSAKHPQHDGDSTNFYPAIHSSNREQQLRT